MPPAKNELRLLSMNTDERILQILENSACLSKGQLLGYIKHTLYPEELRAVELHLNTCALCNDALEGLETQQSPESLLASLIPPTLPALPHREKPKEKKETAATTKEEKAAATFNKAKNTTDAGRNEGGQTMMFRPRKSFAKPAGIAAALLLGFGALWYFEFNKKGNNENKLAQSEAATDTLAPQHDSNTKLAYAKNAANDAAQFATAQKPNDSLLAAQKAAGKVKAKDSTLVAHQHSKDSIAKITAMEASKMLAAREEKESTEVADVAAKKAIAAAPSVARAQDKEDSKENKDSKESKKDLSDFELGLQKYKEKNYASALLYFKSAESDKDDPQHWQAVYYSGLCNKFLDKKRRAIKLFERIVDADAPQKKAAQKQLDELKNKD